MKNLLILIFLFKTASAQHIAYRQSATSKGISMSIPLNTQTKGSLHCIISKEHDRNISYVNYVEKVNLNNFYLYAGAGIHFGNMQTMNYKRDAGSIFLAGPCGIVGAYYQFNNIFIGADMVPRMDAPFFGGCMEHEYCKEATLGSVNFTIGIKLK